MIRQSQRLRRVLRKYALDMRLARLEMAKAERERIVLNATAERLNAARNGIAHTKGAMAGGQLAARGEWSGRLADASIALQPSIQRTEVACAEALQSMRHAEGRIARIEERIVRTIRIEERLKDGKSGFGKHRRKTRPEPQP